MPEIRRFVADMDREADEARLAMSSRILFTIPWLIACGVAIVWSIHFSEGRSTALRVVVYVAAMVACLLTNAACERATPYIAICFAWRLVIATAMAMGGLATAAHYAQTAFEYAVVFAGAGVVFWIVLDKFVTVRPRVIVRQDDPDEPISLSGIDAETLERIDAAIAQKISAESTDEQAAGNADADDGRSGGKSPRGGVAPRNRQDRF